MHWTVQLMIALCAACAALNAIQAKRTGTVRVSGMLVCAMWAVQQTYWYSVRDDSLALFIACDAGLWVYFKKAGTRCAEDDLIEALIWPTLACGIAMHFGGRTAPLYWLNWSMVLAQMLLGLPRPKWQRSLKDFSHGPLRPLENNSGGI